MDESNALGLVADVRRLGWCISQVRGRLSASCWRGASDLQRVVQEATGGREEPRKALDRILLALAALAGFAFDEMTQDAGWRLLRTGRRLERLQFTAQLLARHLDAAEAAQPAHVEWLLEACDSVRVYRSRYVVAPRLAPTLDLLVRDTQHPRALAFQADAVARALAALAVSLGEGERGLREPVPSPIDEDLARLELGDEDAVLARRALAARLRSLSAAAGDLSDRLSARHFAHVGLDARTLAT